MAQVMVNFRLDATIKKEMEAACKEMGITLTEAFRIFATKVAKENRIPFELEVDPFYSKENKERLLESLKRVEAGLYEEHDLIEVDD